jgi:hypothetical protein
VPELLGHRHVTTTQVYDKRRVTAGGASPEMPIGNARFVLDSLPQRGRMGRDRLTGLPSADRALIC